MIDGVVELPATANDVPYAAIHVAVEDVTYCDAAAQVVARLTLPAGATRSRRVFQVPFSLNVPGSPVRQLVARAHVDRVGDREVRVGDFVSMESVPVPTGSPRQQIIVPVKLVQ